VPSGRRSTPRALTAGSPALQRLRRAPRESAARRRGPHRPLSRPPWHHPCRRWRGFCDRARRNGRPGRRVRLRPIDSRQGDRRLVRPTRGTIRLDGIAISTSAGAPCGPTGGACR
jgi:hypothetical protein